MVDGDEIWTVMSEKVPCTVSTYDGGADASVMPMQRFWLAARVAISVYI